MGVYTIHEHRHRFAAWAAARAAQRQFTTVARLRSALDAANIRERLTVPETYHLSPTQFDAVHRTWCKAICDSLSQASVAHVAYGRAAKLVAVYLKTVVLIGEGCETALGRCLHPPIDRTLLRCP